MQIDTEIIKKPLLSDKTLRLINNNQYSFLVTKKSNKIEIKAAIEKLFNVKIKKVNTITRPIKQRRIGRFIGTKPLFKKAIITLEPNQKIQLFQEE
uniref:Large ribosomal subunit protein uL23c n=2 Tax=Pavlovaceae TaxID=418969 RepID=M1JZZ2_DIALT|nr:ribosomal protein L23 [Diacronema lutheri]YP_009863749.1 ribosomal protein L23 [Pavlova sp. NIVA-4/92]AGE93727.1 ribosomal protein L23 [Diacronema lutheri]QKE31080.1 ribosomal protein L23 [Pavlova sp. NIVA-4/92]|mmetsp:Transcript_11229/g.35455  ORF Transcript_11229/g.35455 Transcript_11229/m.35455 type:complete len:96 (+) Transcript_11229:908-1195(+)